MNLIRKIYCLIRIMPILPFVNWKDDCLKKDINRWKVICHIEEKNVVALAILLGRYPEFRNLYIYRNNHRYIYRNWISLWYRPLNTLFLQAKTIGGGLFIQHGFATMISAESIGENCWINQQVTIGFNGNGKAPVIEDNVMITCGAKVLGEIVVGSGSVIGANAVVIRDVEPGSVMVGIPAKRVK